MNSFDTAIALLNSADEEKRLEGIRLLGTIKETRAAEALIEFLRRESRQRKYRWWIFIARFTYQARYSSTLMDYLSFPPCWILERATQSLVNIGHSAVAPLVAEVKSMNIYAEKIAAELFIWALGEIGDIGALPILRPLVEMGVTGIPTHIAAQEAVKKIESANADILDKPIPAAEPQPSSESLPIPAKEPKLSSEDLPRPADNTTD